MADSRKQDNIIEARGLFYSYTIEDENGREEEITAIDGLDADLPRGAFTAIIGHNGSGKSTLAKLLSGILIPKRGTVKVFRLGEKDGISPVDEKSSFEVRKTVGMVFQNPDNQLVATIVEDDVAFAPENLGVPPGEIRRRVDDALETVGLTGYADHDTHKLSGGQKQRVAIAGMLAMEPECIIFDESTAMLDPKGRSDIMDTILHLRDKGITVVLITHYMNEAAKADNILLVDHGRVIMQGSPEDVFYRVEELEKCGLEAPQASALVHEMKKCGINVKTKGVLDAEGAAEAIFEALKSKR